MTIVLTCTKCGYRASGSPEKPLMNRIIMWNHVKRSHYGLYPNRSLEGSFALSS